MSCWVKSDESDNASASRSNRLYLAYAGTNGHRNQRKGGLRREIAYKRLDDHLSRQSEAKTWVKFAPVKNVVGLLGGLVLGAPH